MSEDEVTTALVQIFLLRRWLFEVLIEVSWFAPASLRETLWWTTDDCVWVERDGPALSHLCLNSVRRGENGDVRRQQMFYIIQL